MARMVTREQWLANAEISFQHLVKQLQEMDYIPWGDYEALAAENGIMLDYDYNVVHMENNHAYIEIMFRSPKPDMGGYYEYSPKYVYPVTNGFRHGSIESPDSRDINDNLQRGLVKAAAREYGLAHKLYRASSYKAKQSTGSVRGSKYGRKRS